MRIACSTFSFNKSFAEGTTDVASFVQTCADIGLDAVELNSGYLDKDPLRSVDVKALAVGCALDICALATETMVYVPNEEGVRAYEANLLRQLAACVELGAPILRVNTGQPPNGMHQVPGRTEQQIRAWAADVFRSVARAARGKGILLALENHYALTRTSADTLRFIRAVGEPNMGVNIDTGNCWETPYTVKEALACGSDPSALVPFEDPYELIERLAPHMIFSHCKVYGLTADGRNDAVLDYGRILRSFADSGYRGYLSIENFTDEDPADIVCRSAAMLRQHLAKLEHQ